MKKTGGSPILSFDWHSGIKPEYLSEAAAYLSQADCVLTKENVRRLATRGDATMEWGEDVRIVARHVQYERMAESRGLVPGVLRGRGVEKSVTDQLAQYHTKGAIPVFRGKAPVGPRVRGSPYKEEDTWGIMGELWGNSGEM